MIKLEAAPEELRDESEPNLEGGSFERSPTPESIPDRRESSAERHPEESVFREHLETAAMETERAADEHMEKGRVSDALANFVSALKFWEN